MLDADVLIHFSKAGLLSQLPNILPEYEHIILDKVYEELGSIRHEVDNIMHFLETFRLVKFDGTGEMGREYLRLYSTKGKGESACLAYCRYTSDVIGSNNLRDTREYCEKHGITYLTTLDFFYYAFMRGKMSQPECQEAIDNLISLGEKIPKTDITHYTPHCRL